MDKFFKKSTQAKLSVAGTSQESIMDESSENDTNSEDDSQKENELQGRKNLKKYKQKARVGWLADKRFKKWLIIEENATKCKYCKGILQPKLSTLIKHNQSKKHVAAFAPFSKGHQPRIPFKEDPNEKKTKIAELLNAMFVACHGSIRSIDHLTLLQKKIFPESSVAKTMKLKRTKCSSLLEALSVYFKKELKDDIGNEGFSLIIDESTDISVKKQLGIVIRYYSKNNKRIVNTFLELVELEDSTAKGIAEAVERSINSFGLEIKNLLGLGTDNASTMVGTNKGVITLFKQKNPDIVLIPCICHSVQLAVSSASKNIPSEVDYLISETYNWFSKSSYRQNAYKKTFQLINDGHEPLKIVRACETRWLSIETAVKRISDQWLELKNHFNIASKNEACYKSKHLSELYTDTNFAYLLFLKPVLWEVQKVNKSFESDNADPTKLFSDLKRLLSSLCQQIVLQSDDFNALTSPLHPYLMPTPYFSFAFENYMKSKLNGGIIAEETETIIRDTCKQFLIELIKQLRLRLPKNIITLQKIDVFSVENSLKKIKPKLVSVLGNEIYKHSVEKITNLEIQWSNLVTVPWTKITSTVAFWIEVKEYRNALHENPFSDLVEFVFQFLILPLSNAEVERLFSSMKLLKTKQRNRLKIEMLNSLLSVKYSLKRLGKCCHNFDVTDDILKMCTFNNEDPMISLSSEEDTNDFDISV